MSKYIEREAILDQCHWVIRSDGTRVFVCHAEDIEAAPAADVVPARHERWVNGKCTGCGFDPSWLLNDGESEIAYWVWDEGLDYCPGCGARMDVGLPCWDWRLR